MNADEVIKPGQKFSQMYFGNIYKVFEHENPAIYRVVHLPKLPTNEYTNINKKVYITKNYIEGWKVVVDGKCVDCSKPIYHSHDTSNHGLDLCRKYCDDNKLFIIKVCK